MAQREVHNTMQLSAMLRVVLAAILAAIYMYVHQCCMHVHLFISSPLSPLAHTSSLTHLLSSHTPPTHTHTSLTNTPPLTHLLPSHTPPPLTHASSLTNTYTTSLATSTLFPSHTPSPLTHTFPHTHLLPSHTPPLTHLPSTHLPSHTSSPQHTSPHTCLLPHKHLHHLPRNLHTLTLTHTSSPYTHLFPSHTPPLTHTSSLITTTSPLSLNCDEHTYATFTNIHATQSFSSFSQLQDQQLWLSHQTADSLQNIAMEMEGREKRAAADHVQLVTRVSSALKESKRECQEEGERVRESLGARITDFDKVREHYSVSSD